MSLSFCERALCIFFSPPREGKRVPKYIVREIQASQGEGSKHTRKEKAEVDERRREEGRKTTSEKAQETEAEKRNQGTMDGVHAYT